ncbi:hypothetical protein L198_03638 [Cryptococcus wingfieldii CBS 7118]|uniref:Uncharacterized protein n=1 Tax=Cryptococcus wingfieldii CBS 7118 TaxID=1295528 RepID=A0A1E3JC17_9TREE|nr:hypothetical protein L198_03638 [Cryptococcus wingfieldii CBS 7118]ODN98394.1 hypothetical protein L198_03638 [Cryptococcus wingfieldii CBS 7118]
MSDNTQKIDETPVPIQLTEAPPAPEAPAHETQEKPAEDQPEEPQSCEKPEGACCGGH